MLLRTVRAAPLCVQRPCHFSRTSSSQRMATRASPMDSGAAVGSPVVRGNGGTGAPYALGAAGLLPFIYWGIQHDKMDSKAPPRCDGTVKELIGATGLSPLAFFVSGDQATVRKRFITYGASILSFMSAVQWGLAMAAPVYRPSQYVVSVIPSLWSWLALNEDMRSVTPHSMLGCGFVGVYFYDEYLLRRRLAPSWYGNLRVPLTVVVVFTVVAAAYNGRDKEHVYNN